ncbi:PAQR-type receptor [Martiniozyma asiatica (nom. inval.)]|nr:PAQR-type receptor [Martiniozyma asiatica]
MSRNRFFISRSETKRDFLSSPTRCSTKIVTQKEELDIKIKNTGESHRFKLCTYHELPDWQKDNDFIINGYIFETNNFLHCIQTLFIFNNESVNIFTHLIPGTLLPLSLLMIVPYLLTHSNFIKYIPPFIIYLPMFDTTSNVDHAIFALFTLGFMSCLSCSAIFHTLKIHSKWVAAMGSKLDYAGIILLIATSIIGIIHYSFIDEEIARLTFISTTSIIGMLALCITWHPKFGTSEWRSIRTVTFILFSFSGLVPIIYGVNKFGIVESVDRGGLKFVGLEGLSYLTGAGLYARRFPESLSPGSFDMIGHSHQIFHILVVFGAWFHFKALVHAYLYAMQVTLGGQVL